MPTFKIITNVSANKVPKNFAANLVPVVAKALGKPESYVVVNVQADANLSWGGNNYPAAVSELASIGQITEEKNKETSKTLMDVIEKELGVPKDRHYIAFTNLSKENVGYSGTTFAELM